MSSDKELRVVLLGKTGVGKSSLGNTLLGHDAFPVACGFSSVTFHCQWAHGYCRDVLVKITDTPGVSDTDRPEDEVLKEIGKSVALASPGPHVVLVVVKCGRFTAEEGLAYDSLKSLFGGDITKFLIVVFTREDELPGDTHEAREEVLQTALQNAPGKLKEILQEAGNRHFAVSNIAPWPERKTQAIRLTEMMEELVSRNAVNGANYLTNDLCETVHTRVDAMVQRRMRNDHALTRTNADIQTREAIIRDEEEPGFFQALGKSIKDNLVPVVGQFVGSMARIAAKAATVAFAASRCSIM